MGRERNGAHFIYVLYLKNNKKILNSGPNYYVIKLTTRFWFDFWRRKRLSCNPKSVSQSAPKVPGPLIRQVLPICIKSTKASSFLHQMRGRCAEFVPTTEPRHSPTRRSTSGLDIFIVVTRRRRGRLGHNDCRANKKIISRQPPSRGGQACKAKRDPLPGDHCYHF